MNKKEDMQLKDFVAGIRKKFSPCEIILFGSRANNLDWQVRDFKQSQLHKKVYKLSNFST